MIFCLALLFISAWQKINFLFYMFTGKMWNRLKRAVLAEVSEKFQELKCFLPTFVTWPEFYILYAMPIYKVQCGDDQHFSFSRNCTDYFTSASSADSDVRCFCTACMCKEQVSIDLYAQMQHIHIKANILLNKEQPGFNDTSFALAAYT